MSCAQEGGPRLEFADVFDMPSQVASEVLVHAARIAKIGVWDYDFTDNRAYWSEGVFEIFDLERAVPPHYADVFDYFVPEDRRRLVDAMEEAKLRGTESDLTCRIVSERGLHKFVRVLIRPVSEDGGRANRLRGVVQDVTGSDIENRKEAEAALLEAKHQAEAANSAKSDFLAVMSHELRTPLNPILGFTDLLLDETENPEHLAILRSISEAGQNLTKVIGDVLDFAKIESGRSEVTEEVFDVTNLIEPKVRFMGGQLKSKPVELNCSVEISPDYVKGQRFVGDPDKISRVLSNLVSNAIKFTDAGSIAVDASLVKADDTAMLHVDVRDTGIGIRADDVDQIFEPFRQADSSRTRRHGGTGLGLSICKKLVELMGGRIAARSEPGGGSTFSFVVPLRPAARPEQADEGGFDFKAWARSLAGEDKPHVLLVEDNATNTFYAKHILRGFNCEVTAVASGEEALAQYRAGEHDLLLLDLHMPGIGGMEVLRSIRRSEHSLGWRRVPVVVLTADVLASTREKALKHGADAVLNKPIRARE
ncbi:MAG: hybrid sensor histidine kinase/response regulator, partial [Opitutales bacterium]